MLGQGQIVGIRLALPDSLVIQNPLPDNYVTRLFLPNINSEIFSARIFTGISNNPDRNILVEVP
ncbi:MAG: hypothetical protein HN757_09985 [Calditrichaeota bacterium]|nr:hypothetical protein [Calditrichota bacterium]